MFFGDQPEYSDAQGHYDTLVQQKCEAVSRLIGEYSEALRQAQGQVSHSSVQDVQQAGADDPGQVQASSGRGVLDSCALRQQQQSSQTVQVDIQELKRRVADAVEKAVSGISKQLFQQDEQGKAARDAQADIIGANAILVNPATYYASPLIKVIQDIQERGSFQKLNVKGAKQLVGRMWTTYGMIREIAGAETDTNLANAQLKADRYLEFITRTRKGLAEISGRNLVQLVTEGRASQGQQALSMSTAQRVQSVSQKKL